MLGDVDSVKMYLFIFVFICGTALYVNYIVDISMHTGFYTGLFMYLPKKIWLKSHQSKLYISASSSNTFNLLLQRLKEASLIKNIIFLLQILGWRSVVHETPFTHFQTLWAQTVKLCLMSESQGEDWSFQHFSHEWNHTSMRTAEFVIRDAKVYWHQYQLISAPLMLTIGK